ncbi:Cytoskeleton protein RodZ [Pigmentiphaga humi]|uniref:Cytoskeleton protein RodZ n=1 Tax=Pigmentiphaga humi TaxID=2478468 RepID=A0A3P4B3P2_9BURK|nr:helix-turn-helix domain-containing protein [Pigmentiphaga humi]VCU70248.1 Cytoskeleton protein RodZ [Pigmentiphaga humi]
MSEPNETGAAGPREGQSPASGTPSSSSLGAELARLRELRGWTQEYVSDRLKFAVRQIRALEDEHWEQLPQGTPLRGFVRNYARLLEVDPEPFLRSLAPRLQVADPVSLDQASSLSSPLAQSSRRTWPMRSGGRRRLAPWLVGGLMALVALGLLGYALSQQGKLSFGSSTSAGLAGETERGIRIETPPVPPALADAAGEPSQGMPPAADSAAPAAAPGMAPETLPAPSAATQADHAAASPAAPEQPAPAAAAGLAFTVRQPSWIEVRRADGTVAVSRIIQAREPYELDASGAPYRVVIGNVNGVDVRWRGAPVDLTPYRRDNVARLTLK